MSVRKQSAYWGYETKFHLIPGRLRIGIPGLRKNQELANLIAHRLAKFPGVRLSYANPITGQVLLNFDPAKTDLKPLLTWLEDVSEKNGEGKSAAPAVKKSVGRRIPEKPAPGPEPLPWHTYGPSEAFALLESSPAGGLSYQEAEKRLALFGPNELREERGSSFWQIALDSINGFMTKLLFVAGAVSLLVGETTDAAVIGAIVVTQAAVEAAQGWRAERSLDNLKELSAPESAVLRDGRVSRLPSSELVPGDILLLGAGDMITADAMIIEETSLTTNESCLTGESIPVVKEGDKKSDPLLPVADRANMLFSGTSVTGGQARALVVSTGMQTELGRIASLLGDLQGKKTNLQRQLDFLGKRITQLVVVAVGAIAAIHLLRGRSIWEVLRTGISLAVGAVPEGLPAVLTVALANGVQRMARRNALVRNLSAVETLGSTTTICTDKTGTLTKNEMTVKELYVDHRRYGVAGEGYRPEGKIAPLEGEGPEGVAPCVAETLRVAALCNNAELRSTPEGGWTVLGDPTEGALLTAAAKAGLWWEELRSRYCRHREIAFDARRRLMTVVCREPGGGYGVYVKGSPDAVLKQCRFTPGGPEKRPLDLKTRQDILAAGDAMAQKALRVLAVATRELPPGGELPEEELEDDLIFCGLIGMTDSPREGVREAIQRCHSAGIRVVMITGDHQKTAEAIAGQLGILQRGKSITGGELDRMADADFAEEVADIAVYSRTTPDQKLRIVSALKERGQIVAMTGDGVNDAPAIKEADVGIAMGLTGTDVTREVAGITLSDDNFVTIVDGIEEGRTVSMNLAKSVRYILSGSAGQLLAVFTSAALGLPTPMLPSQILWVNLVTESLPAMSFTADPPERDCMRQPPFDPEEKFWPDQGRAILRKGALSGLIAFTLYAAGLRWGGWSLAKARTMAFSQLVVNKVFDLFAEQRAKAVEAADTRGNPLLGPAAALSASMLAATIYLPFMRPLFSTVPLGMADWGYLILSALAAGRLDRRSGVGAAKKPVLPAPGPANTATD